jgi:hypothetical protein
VARDVLAVLDSSDVNVQETTPCKFAFLFEHQLKEVIASNGHIDRELHRVLKHYADMMPIDTQEIEGINNMIKTTLERAPGVNLMLLNSRVLAKKSVPLTAHGKSMPAIEDAHGFVKSDKGRDPRIVSNTM